MLLGKPITYTDMSAVGWRMTFSINALIMFVLGVATCSTFRANTPAELDQELNRTSVEHLSKVNMCRKEDHSELTCEKASKDIPSNSNEPAAHSSPLVNDPKDRLLQPQHEAIPTPTKFLMGGIWFVVSSLKMLGYFAPIATLVIKLP